MTEKAISERITWLNTNKVFVGDICYALDTHIYQTVWGGQLDFAEGKILNYAVVASTAYGDGCYYGSDGTWYAVDAGVIGVTNLTWRRAGEDYSDERLNSLGKVVDIQSGKAKVVFEADKGLFNIQIFDGDKLVFTTVIETDD